MILKFKAPFRRFHWPQPRPCQELLILRREETINAKHHRQCVTVSAALHLSITRTFLERISDESLARDSTRWSMSLAKQTFQLNCNAKFAAYRVTTIADVSWVDKVYDFTLYSNRSSTMRCDKKLSWMEDHKSRDRFWIQKEREKEKRNSKLHSIADRRSSNRKNSFHFFVFIFLQIEREDWKDSPWTNCYYHCLSSYY